MGGSVNPRTWLFRDGKMFPFEFGYNEADKLDFYAEFNAILDEEELGDLLGLTLLTDRKQPGLIKVEKTLGRANIVFTMRETHLEAMGKDAVPALWEFAPEVGDVVVTVKRLICSLGCICDNGSE